MEIDHPGAKPLTEEEQALLEQFRTRMHERRISTTGLTADDIRHIVAGIRSHPHASVEVIRILREEVQAILPGQRLLTFDWD
ncbi:hypothetical protein KBY66_10530 [Synechococcus sp. Tobar12-5m-g]|jgi:hypothetical protein|uniref:hypothetical protein n=1 Tax=unclassified Synechococcus TaxID=2626047 RepID=UPI0020CF9BF8|nr:MULTISPECIES: hypothetical protein [unclassified Synechococcus]MCP9773058.1 hypothetical protein [Synechococcus sp. Tobar12-5m-g]MCP9873896.1 hypothetical protein [Synechococcus sp. Cruz CV-v-12]